MYGVNSVLIEYGGDHTLNPKINNNSLAKYPFLSEDYVLSVSRSQSDNNLHLLLDAFEKLPGFNLVLISNWDSSDYGKQLKQKYLNKFKNIYIVDGVYIQEELDLIRIKAQLYIHSHSFCGTAPSLVEAMYIGLPIICYNTETNIETTENRSIYFNSKKELIDIIKSLNDDKLNSLKRELKDIAIKRYRWNTISKKYYDLIR